MTAILEARALGKRYGRKEALSDCTLSVPSGRVVGLVGPNGAGKSTLLQLACGLIGPTSGTIEVLGGRPACPAPSSSPRSGSSPRTRPRTPGFPSPIT
ncbi:ATP-binding cassette domain-containing protein [Streptomyces kutzneri]|uniref:ATP-binding cassette domain-containing protein n=1 Tax=Streptomyces kutzneri TaxID=3051179 RepID=UPI0028D68C9F|nr:ATP-binding cassette domain-containing protein [Streptomyces sp. DSM 40907]